MIVHAIHPVPVSYVPRGARTERFEFRRETTPVALREEDPGAFRRVATLESLVGMPGTKQPLFAFEDRLWCRAGAADDFLSLATGRSGFHEDGSAVMRWSLEHTPLCAGFDISSSWKWPILYGMGAAPRTRFEELSQGEPIDLSRARRVAEDGGAWAVQVLTRFLQDEVVLAGGAVFLRSRGPLVHETTVLDGRVSLLRFPNSSLDVPVACRLDRTSEFKDLFGLGGVDGDVRELLRDVDPGLLGDGDILHFVNMAPRVLLREAMLASPSLPSERRDAFLRKVGELRPWQVRAMVGGIAVEDAEGVALLLRGLAEDVLQARLAPMTERGIRHMALYVDAMLLPRIREARPMAETDMDALSSIAM